MIEQRWLEKEGILDPHIQDKVDAGVQCTVSQYSYSAPDEPGFWIPHPTKMGWFLKLQFRWNEILKAHEDGSYVSKGTEWQDVKVGE